VNLIHSFCMRNAAESRKCVGAWVVKLTIGSAFSSTLPRRDTERNACRPPNADASGVIKANARHTRMDEYMVQRL